MIAITRLGEHHHTASAMIAEGATTPEPLRPKDRTDWQRWKEGIRPSPTGKAFTGEALRYKGQRGCT